MPMNLRKLHLRPRETFASKIFVFIIFLVVVLSIAFTGFFFHNQWSSRTQILVRQGEVLARLLAYSSRLGVFAENPELLTDPVNGVLQINEVLRVYIYSQNGKPLKEEGKKGVRWKDKDFPLDAKEKKDILRRLEKSRGALYVRTGEDTIESWAPVSSASRFLADESLFFVDELSGGRESVIGFVRVVLDKKSLDDSLRALLLNSALMAFFFLISAFAIVYFVVKGVTRPLDRLTERVRMMGMGAPLEKVPVETEDEIGKLAAAFNTIAESLQKRESEKEHLEKQLRQACKMEAVGTLAGGVAHDFNNILSTIEGYAALLRDRIKRKGPVRDYVEQLSDAAERASELTRRLLAFSRNQVIHPKPINLNETISNIYTLLVRLLGESVEFHFRATREELVILADELQIEQLLINLVANARDAMPQGGVLSMETELKEIYDGGDEDHWKPPPGSYAKLTVADTGYGIDSSLKERIFEPFFTTKEVGKGTGLGLSMVYGIVKQHSGFIDVESEPGKQTVFTIYFPIADAVVERKRMEPHLLPSGSRETILLAEDDRFVRMLTKHILIKYGYLVIEAVDGEDALEKFRQHLDTVQLLLLDVIMPKKTGSQIYDEAKSIRPDIKVVFMSGHTCDVITRQGVLMEGITLISKPLTPGELLVKIREVLRGSPAVSDSGEKVAGAGPAGKERSDG